MYHFNAHGFDWWREFLISFPVRIFEQQKNIKFFYFVHTRTGVKGERKNINTSGYKSIVVVVNHIESRTTIFLSVRNKRKTNEK
jgi:hypothetical protein